jgi:outer membrane protein OmpA-like peptidoglycan-associated protein
MLKKFKEYERVLIILIMLSFFPKALLGQYKLYNEVPASIDASFTRHSIEASSKKTIFNVLIVKNKLNRQENLTLNITVPQGWNIIGFEKNDITLNPLDSIIIPIRVAVGAKVKGDIGYSIIASLTDIKGNTVKNVYSFVKIPRIIDLNVRYIGKLSFLDPTTNTADFSILIKNKGNREEPVNIILDGNRQVLMGTHRQQILTSDVTIPPYTDSTFTFHAELQNEEFFGKNMFDVKATIRTVDNTLKTVFWFKKTESKFKTNILSEDKPLTIELISQGLLTPNQKPTFSAIISGRTLFKGNSEVYYYYRNFASYKKSDFYERTRMYIGGIVNSWNLEIGDSYRAYQTILFGRGGYLAYQNKKLKAEVVVNNNVKSHLDNLGGVISVSPSINSKIFTGSAYSKSSTTEFESKLGYIGTKLKIKKKHNLDALLGYNVRTQELNGKKNRDEFGGEFNYNSIVGTINTSVKAKYGSMLYNSPQAGRFNLNASSYYQINSKNRIALFYSQNINTSPTIQDNEITNISKVNYYEYRAEHSYFLSRNTQLFWGPGIGNMRWDGSPSFQPNDYFSSINYKLSIGAHLRSASGSSHLTPKFEIARTTISNNPFNNINNTKVYNKFGNQYFSLNYRDRSFNIMAYYTSGPRSLLEQISYAYSGLNVRRFQINPAFDRFIYKDIVRLYAGVSYSSNIIARSSYSNITGQLYWYLPNDWRFYLLTVYSLQKRTNTMDNTETYQNTYVEASIRKEFNIQHPRVKFYNVDIVFFKDFDGNFIQGDNEPGVKNVLLNISKEDLETKLNENIPGDFYSTELLSDNFGRVSLERIPEGLYKIVYNPIGKDAGTFSKALEELTLTVDKSKIIYIPFVEKNKVFGKIILNRSRLSGLGKIDISNIRITATDSKGRTYTTLTNKNGEFVILAPVTDQYSINFNNIFYQDFDLRQNNFKVQFNGYKQFEVNFVLDEKIRRINFSPSAQEGQLANVLQVRKTNLKGSVKDVSSLLPIKARINLINTKTNTVVNSMYSGSQTGDFNISFMADDNYLLEILADGYWYYAETLNLNQVTTFLNVTKDIMLKPITIGSKIELNIRFDINKTDLAPESVAELNRLVKLLKDNGNIKVEVQGHADDLEALNNPQISEERAKRVARYLIENGFSNIQIRGFGNTVPIASNDKEQSRSLNRRVEIEVVSK